MTEAENLARLSAAATQGEWRVCDYDAGRATGRCLSASQKPSKGQATTDRMEKNQL